MAIDPTPYIEDVPFINGPDTATSRLALVPFHEIEVGKTSPYLVKGLIPREGLIVVWGPPKCGKSFWTFDLAMHIALGWSYRGRRIVQGPVVYVACEGAHGFKARIAAYRQRHLADHAGNVPFYLVGARLSLVEEHQALIAEIQKPLGENQPAAVVIDTLNRSITGSESSDEDMSKYVKAADAIIATFNCAVVVVHHCGIEASRPRGHTSLTGAADAQLAVKRNTDGLGTVKLEWMKDGPEGDELSFRLETAEVGTDEDGEPITSCIVVEAERGRDEKRLSPTQQDAFDALVELVNKRQILPISDEKRAQPGQSIAVPVEAWRAEFYRCISEGRDIKRDSMKTAFNRARKDLKRLGKVGFYDDFAWLIWTSGTDGT
jgi:hypothetical protein